MDDDLYPFYPGDVEKDCSDDDGDSDDETVVFEPLQLNTPSRRLPSEEVVDLTAQWEAEYDAAIDLTGEDDEEVLLEQVQSPSSQSVQQPGACGRQLNELICDDGLIIRAGVTVELSQPLAITGLSAPFLEVTTVLDDGNGGAILRGVPFARTKHVHKMLTRKINEVCMLVIVGIADHEVPATRAARVRDLRKTNSAYPAHRHDNGDWVFGRDWILKHSPLVCRWKLVRTLHNLGRKNAKPVEWELARLQEHEADPKLREPSRFLVNKWRGGNIPGGSFTDRGSEVPVVDLNARKSHGQQQAAGRVRLSPGQQYTAGDTFAGAGGASRGIELAGLRLVFAVDHWDTAAKSLKENFSNTNTEVHSMDIHEFVTSDHINYRVDILHLSPPCQVWSPAHTVPGQNDDNNEAALWSCTQIVDKVRPRLFTVEQTFGILAPRFQAEFGLFIRGFTDLGYSVRWKIVHLKLFGLPQPRRRVIILGAGPGEKLPPFPSPTHAENGAGGLRPLVTVRQALRSVGLDPHDELHNPKPFDRPRAPWDPNGLLPNTMTCSGGQNYHWSGTRDFTLREYALLQGFPPFHQFADSYVKKQIGNAFPPSVVKILYKHLVAWLDKNDNIDSSSRRRENLATLFGPRAAGARPVELSDDDDDDDPDLICIKAGRRKRFRRRGDDESDRRPKRVAYMVIDEEEDGFLSDSSGTVGRSQCGSPGLGTPSPSSGSSSRNSNEPMTPRRLGVERDIVDLVGELEELDVHGSSANPVVL